MPRPQPRHEGYHGGSVWVSGQSTNSPREMVFTSPSLLTGAGFRVEGSDFVAHGLVMWASGLGNKPTD